MPIFEAACTSSTCGAQGIPVEHFYPRTDSPMQACHVCHGETQKLMSAFQIVFTGQITARYNDRGKEGAHLDGHWAFEKDAAGKTQSVFIESWDQQKSYCKRNGLANPREISRNFEVAQDGRTVKNSMGMPGSEV